MVTNINHEKVNKAERKRLNHKAALQSEEIHNMDELDNSSEFDEAVENTKISNELAKHLYQLMVEL